MHKNNYQSNALRQRGLGGSEVQQQCQHFRYQSQGQQQGARRHSLLGWLGGFLPALNWGSGSFDRFKFPDRPTFKF